MVYLLTGARLSEILKPKLSWDDVDFENELLTLPFRKGGKSTQIPMVPQLVEVFMSMRRNPFEKDHDNKPEDVLYPFPVNPSYVGHKIKSIMKDAGIDATAHDLRDSFVSHLIFLGYPIADVSELAGHSSIPVTERHYYKQLEERKREMLADLGQHISGKINPQKVRTDSTDESWSTVPSADHLDTLPSDVSNPSPPDDKEGFSRVARDGIEPPTHGFSDHLGLVDKQEKSMENGAVI